MNLIVLLHETEFNQIRKGSKKEKIPDSSYGFFYVNHQMVDFAMTTTIFWLVYMITNIVIGYAAAGPAGMPIHSSRFVNIPKSRLLKIFKRLYVKTTWRINFLNIFNNLLFGILTNI